jgi:hypothetical protein
VATLKPRERGEDGAKHVVSRDGEGARWAPAEVARDTSHIPPAPHRVLGVFENRASGVAALHGLAYS